MGFPSESSIHGLNFIFDQSRSKISRIFWICWFLISLLGLLYYAYISAKKWLVVPDLVLRISQRPTREYPFPAITICSPLFAKSSVVDFRITEVIDENFKPYSEKECEYILANSHWCQSPNLYSIVYHCPENRNNTINITKCLNESSYSADEMLYSHPFRRFIDTNEELLSPLAKFDKILTDQGFCYTTNLQNHHLIFTDEISEDFDSYKRTTILKATNNYIYELRKEFLNDDSQHWTLEEGYPKDEDETFPVRAMRRHTALIIPKLDAADLTNICNEQQFSLIFHLPNEIPTPFHKSYPLEFGSVKKLRVSIVSQESDEVMRDFAPQRRNCYFDGERELKFFKIYTKIHCDWECMTNFTLSKCGCVKFSMPRDSKTRVCTLSESKCYVEAMDSWPNNTNSKGEKMTKACNCLSTCTDIKYGVEVQVDSALNENQKAKYTSWAMVGINDYVAVVQENVVNYKVQNFIADSGGLLGLFMGCSLLSIVELFFFGFVALVKRRKNIWTIKPRKRKVYPMRKRRRASVKVFVKEENKIRRLMKYLKRFKNGNNSSVRVEVLGNRY